jgi:hypothetical protein
MNFFDILRSLLFYSRNLQYKDLDYEGLQSFVPYMMNRWLSFSDKNKAVFTNETLNKFSTLFDDKSETYKFYFNLIPRSNYKKISYVKKKKEDKEKVKEDESIKIIACNNFISIREVKMYLDLQQSVHI